jgi:hypothetical protein
MTAGLTTARSAGKVRLKRTFFHFYKVFLMRLWPINPTAPLHIGDHSPFFLEYRSSRW